eukprot:5599240-Amphidinium_carterae.2
MDNVLVQPWWRGRNEIGQITMEAKNDKDVQTFAATPSGMEMRLLLTISTVTGYAVYTTDVASAFLNTPIDLSTILKEIGSNRLRTDACIFGNVNTQNVYLMAYVDDLLVVGNPATVKPFLEQFKVELMHVSQFKE